MSKKQNKSPKREPFKVTWAHAARDIFVASMNKGQFPLAIAGAIILVILVRVPDEIMGQIAQSVADKFFAGYLVGYALAILFGLGWFFHTKYQRKAFHDELARISAERNDLQDKMIDAPIGSSDVN